MLTATSSKLLDVLCVINWHYRFHKKLKAYVTSSINKLRLITPVLQVGTGRPLYVPCYRVKWILGSRSGQNGTLQIIEFKRGLTRSFSNLFHDILIIGSAKLTKLGSYVTSSTIYRNWQHRCSKCNRVDSPKPSRAHIPVNRVEVNIAESGHYITDCKSQSRTSGRSSVICSAILLSVLWSRE